MRSFKVVLASIFLAVPAIAHHPGERIDEVMAAREPAFEPTDILRAPSLSGTDPAGMLFRLESLDDRIVVVSFAPEGCGAPCDSQQQLLHRVQEGVDVTPMREMVTFLTVGPAANGSDGSHWRAIADDRGASPDFDALSGRDSNAPMIHVIDRGGRHAAIFHGADFSHVNLILYMNELTNAPPPSEPGLLDRIFGSGN